MNRKLQREIIARDKECKICGAEKFLTVHHFNDIVEKKWISAYVTEIPELLVTLCRSCHGHLHGKGGGKIKWEYKKRLVMILFNVDIGCMIHRYKLVDGDVKCLYCGKRANLPSKTENRNCPGLFPK